MDVAAPKPAPGAAPSSPPPYDSVAQLKHCESAAELRAIFHRYVNYMQAWGPTLARDWGNEELKRRNNRFLEWYDAEVERLCPPKPLWQLLMQCMGVLPVAAGDEGSQPLMGTPTAHSTSSNYRSSTCMQGSLTHRRPIVLDSMG